MKRRILLVCLFYCFLRLQIYEAIAAFFWQSASYFFMAEAQRGLLLSRFFLNVSVKRKKRLKKAQAKKYAKTKIAKRKF